MGSSGWLGPLTEVTTVKLRGSFSPLSKKCPQIARSATDIYNAHSGTYAERTVAFSRIVFESSYAVFSSYAGGVVAMVTVDGQHCDAASVGWLRVTMLRNHRSRLSSGSMIGRPPVTIFRVLQARKMPFQIQRRTVRPMEQLASAVAS